MGTERAGELPEDLEAWVAERAAAEGTTREDVVRRLVAAHRLLEERPDPLEEAAIPASTDDGAVGPSPDPATPTGSADDIDELETELGELETELHDLDAKLDELESKYDSLEPEIDELTSRVGSLEDDLDEKIDDVRQRVIQVKRETDAKAPADHDHPEIERRLTKGFENYEEILEYLTEQTETLTRRTDRLAERTDDHGDKLGSVASAVVDLRKRVSGLERTIEKRNAAADLRRKANRRGITTAACESCGESVRLGLLDEPACPHCESPFDGLDPKTGFFGSDRLTVGRRPALESAPDAPGEPPESDAGTARRDGQPDDASSGTPGDSANTESENRTRDRESGRFAGRTVDPPDSAVGGDESADPFEDDVGDLDTDSVTDGEYADVDAGSDEPLDGRETDEPSGVDEGVEGADSDGGIESDGGTDTDSDGDTASGGPSDAGSDGDSDAGFRFGSEVQEE